jgi:hypothetical protein
MGLEKADGNLAGINPFFPQIKAAFPKIDL